MSSQLTIVIPVYNEADVIQKTLTALVPYASYIQEVLVVYDQDSDTTVPVVQASIHNYPYTLCLVKNIYGRGALNAIKTGFMTAMGDAVLVVMADFADDLCVLPSMIKAYEQGADIVCGSRYMPGGKQVGGPLLKKLMSSTAGLTLHWFTRIPTRDSTNSFKLYKRSFLQTTTIESTGGFELAMELTAKAFLRGYTIVEVPSVWTDRAAGESKFKLWSWLPHYIYWYVLLMLYRGPFFFLMQAIKRGIRYVLLWRRYVYSK